MIFADAHTHSNPISGMGIERVGKKFKEHGGWFIAIVSLPPTHYGFPQNRIGYVKAIEIVVSECRKAQTLGLRVACLAGLHPADMEKLVTRHIMKIEEVLSLAEYVLNEITRRCREGSLDGIGEIGRPHYTAKPEAFVVNELILRHALALAKDLGVVIHLHLEQGRALTAIDIDERIQALGLDRNKIVLHHLDFHTAKEALKRNLVFTLPAKYPLLKHAFQVLKPVYMIESDHIDDPKRPGVSAYPWNVIEVQTRLLKEGIVNEDYLARLNIDNIVKTYGVEPP